MLFGDLRIIGDAIAAKENGELPHREIRADGVPTGYNYPSVWLKWGTLGLEPSTVEPWGYAIGAAFLAASALATAPRTAPEALFVGILLCSPVSLLALERGNNDLVIFSWMAVVLLNRRSKVVAGVLLLGAAAAKFYPIAAAVALGEESRLRRRILEATAIVMVFLAYVAISWEEWLAVSTYTPRWASVSFGAPVLAQILQLNGLIDVSRAMAFGLGVLVLVTFCVAWYTLFRPEATSLPVLRPSHHAGLLAGTSVTAFAFLLGNNFQYRAIFLLFCMPGLWTFATAGSFRLRLTSTSVLLGFACYFWWDFLIGESSLTRVCAKQLLLTSMVGALLVASTMELFSHHRRRDEDTNLDAKAN